MAITAADVKKLRDMTGAGMMDAKKALTEAEGDFDKAIEILRVTGAAKAAKRDDRDAANGLVAACGKAMIKLAAETDFVAKNAEFIELAEKIVAAMDENQVADLEGAKEMKLGDITVAETVHEMAVRIGEKLELAEAVRFEGNTEVYLHRRSQDLPPQVGVLVEYEGDKEEFAHDVALQIASMSPEYVTRDEVPENILENERRIAEETAREEGKPDHIIPRIVEGRLNGFFKNVVLLEQQSLVDDKKNVGQLAKAAGVEIKRFARFSAGA